MLSSGPDRKVISVARTGATWNCCGNAAETGGSSPVNACAVPSGCSSRVSAAGWPTVTVAGVVVT